MYITKGKSFSQYVDFFSGNLPLPRDRDHSWKNFFSKGFSGHVKCSFDNPAESFLLKLRTFFAQSPKKIRTSQIVSNIFSKMKFLWTRKKQGWQPCFFFAQSPIIFRWSSKKIHKFIWSLPNFYPKKILPKMQFWQPCRLFLLKVQNLSLKFQIKLQDYKLSEKNTKCFFAYVECSSENPSKNIPLKMQKNDRFWEYQPKIFSLKFRNKKILPDKVFKSCLVAENVILDTQEPFLETSAYKQTFFAQSQKKIPKFHVFSKNALLYLWKSVLRIPAFVWKCTYWEKCEPSLDTTCFSWSFQQFYFWAISDPKLTQKIAALLRLLLISVRKCPGKEIVSSVSRLFSSLICQVRVRQMPNFWGNVFAHKFPWMSRMPFGQTCWKNFAQSPKICR